MTFRQKAVAGLTRRYPLVSGCATMANSTWVQRLSGASQAVVWARVPGGHVLASLNDYVGRAAFFAGDLDRKITWICRRIVRPGDTVLDIGANIGMVTLLLSRLVGRTGHVHAFEPNPPTQRALLRMIEHNRLENVVLHPVALGAAESELELRIPRGNAGGASLVRSLHTTDFDCCVVPVHTLSNIATTSGIEQIRFIKIDVEGFESEVFRGARDLLSRQVPDAILFELNLRTTSTLKEEPVIKLLAESGYRFMAIPKSLLKTRVRPFDIGTTNELPGHDVLAIAQGQRYDDICARVGAIV